MKSVYRTSPHGHSYHWFEAGRENRETIVLVHGFMAHSMTYRRIIDELAPDFRLVIPDLPAHGRDETFRSPDLAPSIEDTQRWLRDLIDLLGEEPVHLVGHSLGATLSFNLAQAGYPLKSLTLVNPGLRIHRLRWGKGLLARFPRRLATLGATRLGMKVYEPIQWHGQRMSREEVQSYLLPLKDDRRLDFMMHLGVDLLQEPERLQEPVDLDEPTLVIWGARDHILPVQDARLIHERLPGSRLSIIDGAGHSPMEDKPAEFVREFTRFLDKIRA